MQAEGHEMVAETANRVSQALITTATKDGLKSTPVSAHPRENRAWTGPCWDRSGMTSTKRFGILVEESGLGAGVHRSGNLVIGKPRVTGEGSRSPTSIVSRDQKTFPLDCHFPCDYNIPVRILCEQQAVSGVPELHWRQNEHHFVQRRAAS